MPVAAGPAGGEPRDPAPPLSILRDRPDATAADAYVVPVPGLEQEILDALVCVRCRGRGRPDEAVEDLALLRHAV